MPEKKRIITPELRKFAEKTAKKEGIQVRSVLRRFQGNRLEKNRKVYEKVSVPKPKRVSRITPEIRKFAEELSDNTGADVKSVLRRFQGKRASQNRVIYDETFDTDEGLSIIHWVFDATFDNVESPLRIAEDWKSGNQTAEVAFEFQLSRIRIEYLSEDKTVTKELQSRKKGEPGKFVEKEIRAGYVLNIWIAKETLSK